jgi:hypothetical protein
VKNLLEKGFAAEVISEAQGLDMLQIKKIIKNLSRNGNRQKP